jgi:hypothetical protein
VEGQCSCVTASRCHLGEGKGWVCNLEPLIMQALWLERKGRLSARSPKQDSFPGVGLV